MYAIVDVDRNLSLWISLTATKLLSSGIPQKNRINISEKEKVPWQFNIRHNINNIFDEGQWTIETNVPVEVYLAIV